MAEGEVSDPGSHISAVERQINSVERAELNSKTLDNFNTVKAPAEDALRKTEELFNKSTVGEAFKGKLAALKERFDKSVGRFQAKLQQIEADAKARKSSVAGKVSAVLPGAGDDAPKSDAEVDKKNADNKIYNEANAECNASNNKYQDTYKEFAPIIAAYSKSNVEIEKDSQNTLYNSFKEISENAATKMKSLSADAKYKGVEDIQKINDRYEQQKMYSLHSMGLLMLITGEYQKAKDHMLSCKTYFDAHADAKTTVNFDKVFDLINSKLEAKIKADKQKADEDAAKKTEEARITVENNEIGVKKLRVAKKLANLSGELTKMVKSAPNFNDASAKDDYEKLIQNRAIQLKDMSDSIRNTMDKKDITASTFDIKPLVGMTVDELLADKKSDADLSKQIVAPFEKQVREDIEKRKTDARAEAVKKTEAEKLQGNADKYVAAIQEAVAAKFKEMDTDASKRPDFLKDEKTYDAFKAARANLLSHESTMMQEQGVMQRMFNDLKSTPGEEKHKAEIAAYMSNPTIIANEKADKVVSGVVTKFKNSLQSKPTPTPAATPSGSAPEVDGTPKVDKPTVPESAEKATEKVKDGAAPAPAAKPTTPASDAEAAESQKNLDAESKALADQINKVLDGVDGKPGLQARIDDFLKIDPKGSAEVLNARAKTREKLMAEINALNQQILDLTFKYEKTETLPQLVKIDQKLDDFKLKIATEDKKFKKEAPAEKIDKGSVKLLAKTLDNIDNGKLKGKVTREGFQKWINSSELRDILRSGADARTDLDINKDTDAQAIVNRVKGVQDVLKMKLPSGVYGIFGLETYKKTIPLRTKFPAMLSSKAEAPAEAAKPADTSEKDPVKNLESFKGKLSNVLKKYTIGKDQVSSLAPSDLKDKNLDDAVKNLDDALAEIRPKRMKLLGILSPVLGAKNEPYSSGPMGDTFSLNVFASKDEIIKHINEQVLNFVRTGNKENKGEEVAAAQANKEFKNARQAFADGDITINPAGSIVAKDGNDWVDKPLKDLNFATKPKV
ncbi:MAG: hypothetical protein NTW69_20980, partial [Chloroflexi bacterium]|nr:hypothetical protein [Chloroflexota bacterium]